MLNVNLQIIGMVLCVVGLLQVLAGPKRWKEPVRFHIAFYISMFLYSAAILAGLVLKGKEGELIRYILRFTVFAEFLLGYSCTYIVMNWLLYRVDMWKRSREIIAYRKVLWMVLAFQTLLLTVSLFTDFFYEIDSSNYYQRNTGFWILSAIWIAEFIFGVFVLCRHGRKLVRNSLVSFVTFAVVVGVAFVLQLLFSEYYFVSVATSIVILVLYLFVVNEGAEWYYQNERELDKLKVDVMLSQIQPHFLYNSLTTIRHLCRSDPDVAGEAVAKFAVFLRGNMDSLSSSAPIDFSDELRHTRAYLSLEKLRFKEDLQIVEQMDCTAFSLPALTLQPIVENAVRHGIRESETGTGTVTTATHEYPDRFVITVTDDGCGFDTAELDKPGFGHVGIRNVRYRLESMCSGRLSFDSVIGQGTVATITLPKDHVKNTENQAKEFKESENAGIYD